MLQCNVHFYFETINSALGLLYSSTQLSTAQNDLITVQTNHATKRNETNFSVARCGPREHPNVWSCDPAYSDSGMFRKVHMAVWPHVEWSKNVRYHSKQTCSKNFEQILSHNINIAGEYLWVTLTWIHQVAKKQIHKIFAETYKEHDPCHTSVVNNEGINQTSKLNAVRCSTV